MSLHLIPLAFGAAVGSAAVFVWKDEALRKRITDESVQLTDKINAYVAGLMNGGAQTMADTLTLEESQQQPTRQPPPQPAAEAGLWSGSDAEPPPSTWADLRPATDPDPIRQADSQPAGEPEPTGQAEPQPAVEADLQPAGEPGPAGRAEPQPAPQAELQPAIQRDSEPANQAQPQPAHEADQHRCEAKTKTGNRCRAKTYAVVSMPWGDIESSEVGLCWRHSQIHEQGGTVPLMEG